MVDVVNALAFAIFLTVGAVATGVMFWIVMEMAQRGRPLRGVTYAATFAVFWPIGLPPWLASRSRYPRTAN